MMDLLRLVNKEFYRREELERTGVPDYMHKAYKTRGVVG